MADFTKITNDLISVNKDLNAKNLALKEKNRKSKLKAADLTAFNKVTEDLKTTITQRDDAITDLTLAKNAASDLAITTTANINLANVTASDLAIENKKATAILEQSIADINLKLTSESGLLVGANEDIEDHEKTIKAREKTIEDQESIIEDLKKDIAKGNAALKGLIITSATHEVISNKYKELNRHGLIVEIKNPALRAHIGKLMVAQTVKTADKTGTIFTAKMLANATSEECYKMLAELASDTGVSPV